MQWYKEAARLAKVGQIDKIEAFDQKLMRNANEVASQHYKMNWNQLALRWKISRTGICEYAFLFCFYPKQKK